MCLGRGGCVQRPFCPLYYISRTCSKQWRSWQTKFNLSHVLLLNTSETKNSPCNREREMKGVIKVPPAIESALFLRPGPPLSLALTHFSGAVPLFLHSVPASVALRLASWPIYSRRAHCFCLSHSHPNPMEGRKGKGETAVKISAQTGETIWQILLWMFMHVSVCACVCGFTVT